MYRAVLFFHFKLKQIKGKVFIKSFCYLINHNHFVLCAYVSKIKKYMKIFFHNVLLAPLLWIVILHRVVDIRLMPYPCSHFYVDIKFGDRLYSKEKRRAWPLLFWIWSVAKIDTKVKVTTWIGQLSKI